jgi:hypothetical protein
MNRFALKNTFIKVYIYNLFIKYFCKKRESKLGFGDRVVVLNDIHYGYRGSTEQTFHLRFSFGRILA